jgi:hypothetical protein
MKLEDKKKDKSYMITHAESEKKNETTEVKGRMVVTRGWLWGNGAGKCWLKGIKCHLRRVIS